MRNEFIGLKLMETLKNIANEKRVDHDLQVQLDVFHEQKESDEAHVIKKQLTAFH